MTIVELEKEKHELLLKMSQFTFKSVDPQPLTRSSYKRTQEDESLHFHAVQNASSSTFLLDQIIKEKNELEKKYKGLFTSYSVLLDHNKALSEKIEHPEKKDLDKHKTKKLKKDFETSATKLNRKRSVEKLHTDNKRLESPRDGLKHSRQRNSKHRIDHNHSPLSTRDEEILHKSSRRPLDQNDKSIEYSFSKKKDATMILEELKSLVLFFNKPQIKDIYRMT